MIRGIVAAGNFEVLIVQTGGGATSAPVLQALRDKRFAPRVVADFNALPAALKKVAEPILVVEVGGGDDESRRVLAWLQEFAKTNSVPVVVAGTNFEQFERILDQAFPAATTLNVPYGSVEMLAAVNYITRTVTQRRQRKQQADQKAKENPSTVAPSAAPAAAKVAPLPAQSAGPETVPDIVFEQLKRLDLLGKTIGGEPLSGGGLDEQMLRNLGLVPVRPAVREAIDRLLIDAGKWGRLHLTRVSYMAQRMVMPMNPEASLLEAVKASSILWAWSFAGNSPEYLKRAVSLGRLDAGVTGEATLSSGALGAFRIELASKMKDSALAVMQDLKLERESRIISLVARMMGGELRPTDDDVSIVASAIMAADVTDRLCYANGLWNPRRAYSFLNRLKRGEILDFHPIVLCCLVKLLAEAIAARTPMYLLPKELRKNKELQAQLMNQARQPVDKHEKRVSLASLAPGMKLSRPLMGLDGTEVLSSDIKLDQDLIWRIWQLSAVRPLRSAVVLRPEDIENNR